MPNLYKQSGSFIPSTPYAPYPSRPGPSISILPDIVPASMPLPSTSPHSAPVRRSMCKETTEEELNLFRSRVGELETESAAANCRVSRPSFTRPLSSSFLSSVTGSSLLKKCQHAVEDCTVTYSTTPTLFDLYSPGTNIIHFTSPIQEFYIVHTNSEGIVVFPRDSTVIYCSKYIGPWSFDSCGYRVNYIESEKLPIDGNRTCSLTIGSILTGSEPHA